MALGGCFGDHLRKNGEKKVLKMKAKPYKKIDNKYEPCEVSEATYILIYVPGPFHNRMLPIILKGSRDKCERSPIWSWNGDTEKPTLKPSILTNGKRQMTDEEYQRAMKGEKIELDDMRCHTWINDGKVQFLNDCTHEFAGQTLDLLEIDD